MESETTTMEASCKNEVLSRIEHEHICPRPKSFYTRREILVWGLWSLSILIGALAFAVMCFTFLNQQYGFYEATHENLATFIIDVLPYAWIVAFGLMAGIAVYNVRHTKHGYRYSIPQILLSSVVLSLAGGAALHLFGFGYAVDHALGKQMPLYLSQEKMEAHLWQNPEEGRLVGRISKEMLPLAHQAVFTDVSGKNWRIDTSDLTNEEQQLLFSAKRVRLIGELSESGKLFHSCGAFPWLLDHAASRADFEEARRTFEMKMHSYEEKAERVIEHDTKESAEEENICGHLAPVHRMSRVQR